MIVDDVFFVFKYFNEVDVVYTEFVEAFFIEIVGVDAVGMELFGVFWKVFGINHVFARNHANEDVNVVFLQQFLNFP